MITCSGFYCHPLCSGSGGGGSTSRALTRSAATHSVERPPSYEGFALTPAVFQIRKQKAAKRKRQFPTFSRCARPQATCSGAVSPDHLLAALMKVSIVLSKIACCAAGKFSICSSRRRIFRLGFLPRAAFFPASPSNSSVETWERQREADGHLAVQSQLVALVIRNHRLNRRRSIRPTRSACSRAPSAPRAMCSPTVSSPRSRAGNLREDFLGIAPGIVRLLF